MIDSIKDEIIFFKEKSIFSPDVESIKPNDWESIINKFQGDYQRYYSEEFNVKKIKYFPALLATFFYRIARFCFLNGDHKNAQEFSSLAFSHTGIEIYYSAEIGNNFKMNHGVGTIIGARTKIGNDVLMHHNITLGDKNGGRPTIGNGVTIYLGTVIVGDIIIGDNSVIGANVFVDKSYPENSKIF